MWGDDEREISSATYYVGNKKIGEAAVVTRMQSVELAPEYKEIRFSNREYVATLTNVMIAPDFWTKLNPDNRYDVVLTGVKLPKGKRMPKSKRLRKKYRKKYTEEQRLTGVSIQRTLAKGSN